MVSGVVSSQGRVIQLQSLCANRLGCPRTPYGGSSEVLPITCGGMKRWGITLCGAASTSALAHPMAQRHCQGVGPGGAAPEDTVPTALTYYSRG